MLRRLRCPPQSEQRSTTPPWRRRCASAHAFEYFFNLATLGPPSLARSAIAWVKGQAGGLSGPRRELGIGPGSR